MPAALKSAETLAPPQGATAPALAHLSLASGEERPVRSPALELQEALEAMLAANTRPAVRPAAAAALALGAAGVLAACAAFWFSLARTLIAAI